MSRFYQPAVPTIGTDFMFDVPWDEIAKTMEIQQTNYVNNMKSATTLMDAVDVKHLNTDFDNRAVKEAQQYYQQQVDALTKRLMEDPTARITADVIKISSDMQKNLKDGPLGKAQGRYNAVQTWQEANKEMQEKHPDIYNRAYQAGMNSLSRGYQTLGMDARWGEDNIMEDIDWSEKISDIMKDMTPDMTSNGYANVGGQWIYTGKEENKHLSQTRILQALENRIKSDPRFAGYVQQRGRYGLPGYYDAEGKMIPMFTKDEKGNTIINMQSAFGSPLKAGAAFAYNQHSSERKLQDNPYALQAQAHKNAKELKRMDQPPKESASSIFYSTTTAVTPEQLTAMSHDLNSKYASGFKIAGISGGNTLDKMQSLRTTLLNSKQTPFSQQMLIDLENDIRNYSNKESSTGANSLYLALSNNGRVPANVVQDQIGKLETKYTTLFNDPNLLRTTPGLATIKITHPNGRVTTLKKKVNGMDDAFKVKTNVAAANEALSTMGRQLQQDPQGSYSHMGIEQPYVRVFTSDPNYRDAKGNSFSSLNGVSKKLVYGHSAGTTYGIPSGGSEPQWTAGEGATTRVEVDYMVSFDDAGVEGFSTSNLGGHAYQNIQGINPSANATPQTGQNFRQSWLGQ